MNDILAMVWLTGVVFLPLGILFLVLSLGGGNDGDF